jgi:hypothetical protein
MGNQSAGYFWLIKLVEQAALGWYAELGHEFLLRLPSMIAFSLSLGIVVWLVLEMASRRLPRPINQFDNWQAVAFAGGCCLLLATDRLQWFYASEARVYSLNQLLSLASWLAVAGLIDDMRSSNANSSLKPPRDRANGMLGEFSTLLDPSQAKWLQWNVFITLLLHFHVTSGLVVVTQWAGLTLFSFRTSRSKVLYLLSTVWLGLNIWLVLSPLGRVWDRRQQWSPFAGDAGLPALVEQFPVLAMLAPVAFVWLAQHWLARRGLTQRWLAQPSRQSPPPEEDPAENSPTDGLGQPAATGNSESPAAPIWMSGWFWAAATAGPLVTGWMLTGLAGVPVFHYRFLIGGVAPLYLLMALILFQLRWAPLRWLCLSLTILWIVASQGTLRNWQQGHLIGTLRGEDWRAAIESISRRIDTESEIVWCSPGLIESRTMSPPLSRSENEYLTFPLRGAYQIASEEETVPLVGLVGDSRHWSKQLTSRRGDSAVQGWILHRGTRKGLQRRLEKSGLQSSMNWGEIESFGRVSLVRFQSSNR